MSKKQEQQENVQPEPQPESAETANGQAQEDALQKAVAEAEDMKRKWYSVTAEYENYRKRTQAARSQAYADGRSDVIASLFPIADNLERAIKSCADEKTLKGLEMVVKSFEKLLADEKIEEVCPLGEPFDPAYSEAIMAVDDESLESGTVKEVYLKGYVRDGKALRYAQVVVVK